MKKNETKQELLDEFKGEIKSIVDDSLKSTVEEALGKGIADKVEQSVLKMRADRIRTGMDVSGLLPEQKQKFMSDFKEFISNTKAAMLGTDDSAGGYLVPEEVNAGIIRVAATNGYVIRDAMRIPMGSDKKDVPRYTGSDLLGDYYGQDEEGSETTITFEDAKLVVADWRLLFRANNSFLSDASVDAFDWLSGLIAEGLAARADKEGFQGGSFAGSPFVGLLGSDDVTVHTMATGNTDFEDFSYDDAVDMISQVETSVLADAAFYMHRTVWAQLLKKKDTAGNYIVGANNSALVQNFKRQGLQPAGQIDMYPVFTSDYMPANSATAVSTKFAAFASLSHALLFGEREGLRLAQTQSGQIGGKDLFAANQTGLRATHRHAIAIGLPSSAVVAKTAAS